MTPDEIRKRAGRIRTLNPSADGRKECALLLALAEVVEAADALITEHYEEPLPVTPGNAVLRIAIARVEALKP